MSRLLVFNLATDADDPVLGFTTVWLNRLAARYDALDVITMRMGRLAVAPNVRVWSVGKERGWPEWRRSAEFYRLLRQRLVSERYDACFAHMMPLFAVMGAPLLKLARVPITVWYTHRSPHWTVRAAIPIARRVVTAAPDSFPLPTPKLRVLGHGIDTDFFASGPAPETDTSDVVHVARLMPIKHQATLIRAVAALPGLRAVIVGDVPPEQDQSYPAALRSLAESLGVTGRVHFAGAQPASGVRDAYQAALAAVNLSPPGLFDKAALEAVACATPTIVSNPAFDDLLGDDAPRLRIAGPDDAAGLAERLSGLQSLPTAERSALGQRLRERVIASHSLDRLMDRLVRVLETGEPA